MPASLAPQKTLPRRFEAPNALDAELVAIAVCSGHHFILDIPPCDAKVCVALITRYTYWGHLETIVHSESREAGRLQHKPTQILAHYNCKRQIAQSREGPKKVCDSP